MVNLLKENTMLEKSLLPICLASIFAVSLLATGIPLASASTVNITLNPTSGLAQVASMSNTVLVFRYPSNSSVSNYLNGFNYSQQLSGFVPRGTVAAEDFQNVLRGYSSGVSVQNMSVSLNMNANANTTALVITRNVVINTWVSGVFNGTGHNVTADLRWKAFVVKGSFNVPLDGHDVDLNMMGSAMLQPLGNDQFASGFLGHAFGEDSVWSKPTIDFSALNSPLTNWTRNYDSSTNTTTFTKNISAQANYSASVSVNGQTYSISMTQDPSSTIKVLGYAVPSGDSLTFQPAPAAITPIDTVLIAVLISIAGIAAYVSLRSRSKKTVAVPKSALIGR